jgi:hypothetical protein
MAPASPIPIESDKAVIPNENCLFSNGTWKQISQSDRIFSSDIQIISIIYIELSNMCLQYAAAEV